MSSQPTPGLDAAIRDLVIAVRVVVEQIVTERLRLETYKGDVKADLSVPLNNPISREALLSLPEVMRLTNLGQTEVYERMKASTFPVPKQIGLRRVAWPAGRVLDWIEAQPDWVPSGKSAVGHKKTV